VGRFFSTGGPAQFGHDTFVFDPQNGNDLINDFHQGEDIIELDGFFTIPVPTQAAQHIPPEAGISQFLETFSDLNIEEVNGSSVIHFDANNSVTVVGVAGLTAADFHFVV
jgi:serralysin